METLIDRMKVLKSARVLADLTQDELADKAKVNRLMIGRIEKQDVDVPASALEKVQDALKKAKIVFIAATSEHGMAAALKK